MLCITVKVLCRIGPYFERSISCNCRLLGQVDDAMRDRRKELIRQWLKEPTGSEEESNKRGGLLHQHSGNPQYTISSPKQEREALDCMENCVETKLKHETESNLCHGGRWYESRRGNRSPPHEHDHERSKYRKMLVRFLESQNRVFCFPPQLNSFQRMLVHVEAGKLGLDHRSCGQGWERFMVVTKPGNWKEDGKSECFKLGENVCGNAEEVMSSDLSDRSLPSLASKLSQVLGRCPQMVQNENLEPRSSNFCASWAGGSVIFLL